MDVYMRFDFSSRTTIRTSLEDVIQSNVLMTVTSHNIAKSCNEQMRGATRGKEFFSMLLLPDTFSFKIKLYDY